MEAENKKVHQGKNVYFARVWRNISQEALANAMDLNQNDISRLEKKEEVEPQLLKQISEILNIQYDFFTEFQMEDALAKYMNDQNVDNINDSGQAFGVAESVINNPVEDVHKAYDKMIDYLKCRIEKLEEEIRTLKGK